MVSIVPKIVSSVAPLVEESQNICMDKSMTKIFFLEFQKINSEPIKTLNSHITDWIIFSALCAAILIEMFERLGLIVNQKHMSA